MKRYTLRIALVLIGWSIQYQHASAQINDPADVFMEVDQEPTFKGGKEAYYDYLSKNIKYPKAAKENKTEGRVILTYIVNTDGSLQDIQIVRGIGSNCDEEALRVFKKMPDWNPGVHKGKKVRTRMQSVITFKLP